MIGYINREKRQIAYAKLFQIIYVDTPLLRKDDINPHSLSLGYA